RISTRVLGLPAAILIFERFTVSSKDANNPTPGFNAGSCCLYRSVCQLVSGSPSTASFASWGLSPSLPGLNNRTVDASVLCKAGAVADSAPPLGGADDALVSPRFNLGPCESESPCTTLINDMAPHANTATAATTVTVTPTANFRRRA